MQRLFDMSPSYVAWSALVGGLAMLAGCAARSSAPPPPPQYPPGAYQGTPPPTTGPRQPTESRRGPEYPPGAYQSQAPPPAAQPNPQISPPPAAQPNPQTPSSPPAVGGSSASSSPPEGDPCACEGYCPYDAPCQPKHPPRKCRETDHPKHIAAFAELAVWRVGGYHLRGGPEPRDTYGFLFMIDPDVIGRGKVSNKRGTLYAAIGGGSAGLEGQLEGASTAGAHLGQGKGVAFVRGGFGFQVLGNNDLYRSHLEFPRFETGYQLFTKSLVLELQGNTGVVLGGRYNVGHGAKRRIDTVPRVGTSATLQSDELRLHLMATRIFALGTGTGAPIDQLGLDLCGQLSKLFIACAHGVVHHGDVHWPDGTTSGSTALYGGGTIGVGAIDVD